MLDIENLQEQLNSGRSEIKTDSLSMSIGEIINLYKDGDLELSPAYQRLFRWDDEQKSKFIESILLGIPLPPIFVAQNSDSTWSVVDGLQRLSTVLQLTGDLEETDVNTGKTSSKPPLMLTSTKKLSALKGFTWESLPNDIKRTLKRSKLGINIILTENSIHAQYELFQRLNTGGLHLSPQEIRNCLIIMLDNNFYDVIDTLKNYSTFKKTVNYKESKLEIESHMELVLRFFISKHNNINFEDYKSSDTLLSDFVDNETIKLIDDKTFDIDSEIEIFKRTFNYLYKVDDSNIFKKYNSDKEKFTGAFLLSNFEAITTGVANNIEEIEKIPVDNFRNLIIKMHANETYLRFSNRGTRVISRIKGMIDFSNNYFNNAEV